MYGQEQRVTFGFGFRLTPWVKRLIIANAVIYVVMWIGGDTGWLSADLIIRYFAFTPAEAYLKPWTLVTYMFLHGGFLHVLINMLMLFFFGPPLESRWGGREFIKYYLICGVAGAVLSLITLITPLGLGGATSPIVGASGAIFGVMLAYALNWPDALIWIYAIFPVKAKYVVMFLGIMTFIFAFRSQSDGIAHFAHLGGLVAGLLYLKRGWRLQLQWESLKKRLRRRKLSVVPGGADAQENRRSAKADEEKRILEVVDKLLDKIAAQGIESLTPEERRFLDDVSKRRQAQHQVRH
jgi:membrane associated rhomboid family serine protease